MNAQSVIAAAELGGHQALLWLNERVLVWATLVQAAIAVGLLVVLWLLAPRATRALTVRLDRLRRGPLHGTAVALAHVLPWIVLVLLAWFAEQALSALGQPVPLLRLLVSLALAWVAIRLSSSLVRDPKLAQAVAVAAWIVALLNIIGLIGPILVLLGAMAITIGTLRLSVLLAIKGAILLTALIWFANAVSRLVDQRLGRFPNLTPAMQVLAVKLVRIVLLTIAVVVALGAVGIDLTAFAVFSGAVGVGIGFGLQAVVSNLISGVILLLDRSIKPGDVIEIGSTYGWITRLNARFVSVATRDGIEHLIPNQDLITQRVINWSYSNDLVRVHVAIGVSYLCDLRLAMRLGLEAVAAVPRVLREPAPVCLLTGFGDSAVNLELRFWISDPRNGIANLRSAVLLNVWDRYREHGIDLPFPQRDLNIRDPGAVAAAVVKAWADAPRPDAAPTPPRR